MNIRSLAGFFSVALTIVFLQSKSPTLSLCQEVESKSIGQASENPESLNVINEVSETDQDRIDRLAAYLTQTRWTGQFTITGAEEKPPAPEYYEILKAEKAENGDYWNLLARIKYGDKDATLPLPPIEIKWAGQTPVITVDRVTVPGFGTFDARVLIRRGQYAGTWSHDNVGGHLFGKIEKMAESEKDQN